MGTKLLKRRHYIVFDLIGNAYLKKNGITRFFQWGLIIWTK